MRFKKLAVAKIRLNRASVCLVSNSQCLSSKKELTRLSSVILTDEIDIFHTQCQFWCCGYCFLPKAKQSSSIPKCTRHFVSFLFQHDSIKSGHLALFSERTNYCVFKNKMSLVSYMEWAVHGHVSSKAKQFAFVNFLSLLY